MKSFKFSRLHLIAIGLLFCVAVGWGFYFFGLDAFLEAAYSGESWSYFNEYAARWRDRQADPQFSVFLREARALLFRYAVVGTAVVLVAFGAYAARPSAFTNYFSAKTSPYNLALFRIALFGVLLMKGFESVQWYAQLPEALQIPPPGWSSILPFLSTDPTLVSVLQLVFWAACICGLLGLYTRISASVALITGLYVMGIPQFYGKVNHYHHLLWGTALLIPSRCADVLSLDALRQAGRSASVSTPEPDRAYALPLRYIWILVGIIYFFPGFWKLAGAGLEWAFSDNLKYQMRTLWFAKAHAPIFRMDQYPLLYQGAGAFTLLFETGFIFTLPFRSLRPWGVGAAVLFHETSKYFLSIYFWTLYAFLPFLLDVRSFFVWLGRWLYPDPLILVYDDEEAWQRRIVEGALRMDLFDQVRARVEKQGPSSDEKRPLFVSASPPALALWSEGRAQASSFLRLGLYVPVAVPFFPLALLAKTDWGLNAASTPRASGPLAVTLIGSFLIVANVVCGVGKINSYPFSVYPRFAVKKDSTVTTLRVEGVDQSGASMVVLSGVQDQDYGEFTSGRFRGLVRSIRRVRDPDERKRKLRALWSVLREQRPEFQSIITVRFYETVYSNDPDRTSDRLLSKSLYTTLDVTPDISTVRPGGNRFGESDSEGAPRWGRKRIPARSSLVSSGRSGTVPHGDG